MFTISTPTKFLIALSFGIITCPSSLHASSGAPSGRPLPDQSAFADQEPRQFQVARTPTRKAADSTDSFSPPRGAHADDRTDSSPCSYTITVSPIRVQHRPRRLREIYEEQKKILSERATAYLTKRLEFDEASAALLSDYGEVLIDIRSLDSSGQIFNLDTPEGKVSYLKWYLRYESLIDLAHRFLRTYCSTLRARPNDGSRGYRNDLESAGEIDTIVNNLYESIAYGKDLIRLGWRDYLAATPEGFTVSPIRT